MISLYQRARGSDSSDGMMVFIVIVVLIAIGMTVVRIDKAFEKIKQRDQTKQVSQQQKGGEGE